jgi:hypothetical protein
MRIPRSFTFALGTLAFSCLTSFLAAAQDPQNGGWRRLGESNPYPSNAAPPAANSAPSDPQDRPLPAIPPTLTIKPGTYVTVRINQALSSDRNQAGDAFSATLVKPVIVDGVVVAERGQTVGGHVTEAKKAGRVQGVSRLGVQLIDLPIVDGEQLPIQSSLISRNGPTSEGRDAAAIAGTTATGAAIGAAVGWGTGAAIGAGAGAAAGLIGVLLTRGEPTIVYPESVLTFRIDQPVTVSTERAPYTFRYVDPRDYEQSAPPARMQTRAPGYRPAYGPAYGPYGPPAAPYPYYGGYYYGGYPFYGGYFWGPSVVIGFRGHRW